MAFEVIQNVVFLLYLQGLQGNSIYMDIMVVILDSRTL